MEKNKVNFLTPFTKIGFKKNVVLNVKGKIKILDINIRDIFMTVKKDTFL